jgi:uncharacterized protein YdaU (DUF1376 family)
MKKVKAWMPLYVSDFLIATLGWDAEAVGHYIRLLLIQWDRGSLPSDSSEWDALSPKASEYKEVLESKFPICSDGLRRNARLEEEREKAQEVYTQRVKAGRKGAKKRWGGDHSNDESSSSDHPTSPPSKAATRGHADAKKAYDLAPVFRQQGWKRFFRAWNEIVMKQLIEPEKVVNAFSMYYDSPQGSGKFARGPHRLLEEEVWEDDPVSWETQESSGKGESMAMLDDIIGGGE